MAAPWRAIGRLASLARLAASEGLRALRQQFEFRTRSRCRNTGTKPANSPAVRILSDSRFRFGPTSAMLTVTRRLKASSRRDRGQLVEQLEFNPTTVRRASGGRASYERRRLTETCNEAWITKTFVMQMMSEELEQKIRRILDSESNDSKTDLSVGGFRYWWPTMNGVGE